MIQAAECPPFHLSLLVGQIGRHPLTKPRHRLSQADLVEIPHHIRVCIGAGVSGYLTAQGEIALIIQVQFFQDQRGTREKWCGAEIPRGHRHRYRCLRLQAPDLGFDLTALRRGKIQPTQRRLQRGHQVAKAHTLTPQRVASPTMAATS
jgi:hypothetical protein